MPGVEGVGEVEEVGVMEGVAEVEEVVAVAGEEEVVAVAGEEDKCAKSVNVFCGAIIGCYSQQGWFNARVLGISL